MHILLALLEREDLDVLVQDVHVVGEARQGLVVELLSDLLLRLQFLQLRHRALGHDLIVQHRKLLSEVGDQLDFI